MALMLLVELLVLEQLELQQIPAYCSPALESALVLALSYCFPLKISLTLFYLCLF
jgi:hypothetical protein